MKVSLHQCPEDELKKMLQEITDICLSEEFMALRLELEELYRENKSDNAFSNAFQDALYTLLVQKEDAVPSNG